MEFRGEKYEHGRDVKDIAVLLRKDIKEAVAAGRLPDTKYSVRIRRYSMGRSLDVRIGAVPFDIHNVACVMSDPHRVFEAERYTPLSKLVIQRVIGLVLTYKRDDSDSSTDYYSVNFSDDVSWDHEVLRADAVAIARREGAMGCSTCYQRGCLLCAPEGYSSPRPSYHQDAAKELERLAAEPAPFCSVSPPPTLLPDSPSEPTPPVVAEPALASVTALNDFRSLTAPKDSAQTFPLAYRLQLVRDETVYLAERPTVNDPAALARLAREVIPDDGTEHFGIFFCDLHNRVIGQIEISHGGLAMTSVSAREVMRGAILANAATIVLYHNHLSGEPTPSSQDRELTRILVRAGVNIGISVLDHVIVASDSEQFASMSQRGEI